MPDTAAPIPTPGVLNRAAIAALIAGDADGAGDAAPRPLITDYIDLPRQLQPNGFDLTLRALAPFTTADPPGVLGDRPDCRALPTLSPSPFAADGWATLPPGAYRITFNETVNLPRNLMALCRPRSSLLRAGVSLHTAVWDAGYCGRGQALLAVHHPAGWRIRQNAAIAQLVFLPLAALDAAGYAGAYQHENP